MRRRQCPLRDTNPERPRFSAGEHVHYIQARKALEDRGAWRFAGLVHAGDGHIDVELGGEHRRYRCRFADDRRRWRPGNYPCT